MGKPILFFIEESLSPTEQDQVLPKDAYEVYFFNDPLIALQTLVDIKPWVIISDQQVKNLKGDEFLSLSRQISPFSIRVLRTSVTDERLLLDCIRKSQVNDFIKKPLSPELMKSRIEAAIELYLLHERHRLLGEQNIVKDEELKELNYNLNKTIDEFSKFKKDEVGLRREIECWAPPAIVSAIKKKQIPKSSERSLVTLAFTIPAEVVLPEVEIEGRTLRFQLLRHFSDVVFRYGGWRSTGGVGGRITSAYFGLMRDGDQSAEEAMAAALAFKTAVENLYRSSGASFPCYIMLHYQDEIKVQIQTTVVNTPEGPITQKNFEMLGIDYEYLSKLKEQLKKTEGCSIVASDFLKRKLKNPSWRLPDGSSQ